MWVKSLRPPYCVFEGKSTGSHCMTSRGVFTLLAKGLKECVKGVRADRHPSDLLLLGNWEINWGEPQELRLGFRISWVRSHVRNRNAFSLEGTTSHVSFFWAVPRLRREGFSAIGSLNFGEGIIIID